MIGNELGKELVNRFFKKLVIHYPAYYKTLIDNDALNDAKKEWTQAIIDSHIDSYEKLSRGLKRTGGSPFLPSPHAFIELCRAQPEDIHAPSASSAFIEASTKVHPCYGGAKNWRHVAVKLAAYRTGAHFLSTESKGITEPVFEKNYLEVVREIDEGKIVDQLEAPEENRFEETEAEKKKRIAEPFKDLTDPHTALNAMREILGRKPKNYEGDANRTPR